jgi:hypothetical protein
MHLSGRCNCGSITYEFDGDPLLTGFCHCKTCQRQTGSSGSIFVCVNESGFNIDGAALKTFVTNADSGHDVQRIFCGHCGSPVISRCDILPGKVFIKAGTLDDASMLIPTAELWCEEAQGWMLPLTGAKRFQKGR